MFKSAVCGHDAFTSNSDCSTDCSNITQHLSQQHKMNFAKRGRRLFPQALTPLHLENKDNDL